MNPKNSNCFFLLFRRRGRGLRRLLLLVVLFLFCYYYFSGSILNNNNNNNIKSTTTTTTTKSSTATAEGSSSSLEGKDSSSSTTTPPLVVLDQPNFEKRLAIAKRFAYKVANYQFLRESQKEIKKRFGYNITSFPLVRLGESEWYIQDITHNAGQESCLVYSFGVADSDVYTELMAKQMLCQVYAMDPTVTHPQNWMTNVTFFPWGLSNRATSVGSTNNSQPQDAQKVWSHPIYGTITGTFYTLPEIMKKLNHLQPNRKSITAMKLDCEGCEFSAFEELMTTISGVHLPFIKQIDVEFHFAKTLGMVDANDIARMYYAHVYLKQNRCLLVRQKRHAGYKVDQDQVPALLVKAGVSKHHCCYEMTYMCDGPIALPT